MPDVAYQASSRTAVLVYDTAPGDAQGGLRCPAGNPCSAGWYVVGGTSSSTPQWARLVAIAGQIAGHGLGLINPTLYALASGPNYGSYFYDVTTGNNQANPAVPGYPATTGCRVRLVVRPHRAGGGRGRGRDRGFVAIGSGFDQERRGPRHRPVALLSVRLQAPV